MINKILAKNIIKNALNEDINSIDITTDNLIDEDSVSKAYVLAKEPGILAGLVMVKWVFEELDENMAFKFMAKDGDEINTGDKLLLIQGKTKAILKGERLALNILQRMSGIASMANEFNEIVKNTKTKIVDTRKTTPGLRMLEKYAVRVGGCSNHRYNLSDGVIIKDNHITAAGGIKPAIDIIKSKVPHTFKIEVEVRNTSEFIEAIEAGADIILLDNMDIEEMKEAVEITEGRVILEASGGMTREKIVEISKIGVDLISVGALTHSFKSLDISLKIVHPITVFELN